MSGIKEAQERDEIEAAVRKFCDTAPRKDVMALGVLAEMLHDDDAWRLVEEAVYIKGIRGPMEVIDYVVENRAD